MNKHFEPVTARSLAEKIVDKAQQFSPWQTRASQKNAIESIIEPHIRKPSDDDKSVPARCEEAYNEALDLLASAADIITKIKEFDKPREWLADRRDFINKPNPFKEADIVHEGDTKPIKAPFSLELAEQGHKVVTRDGRPAKIICDDLHGFNPIMAIVTNDDGEKSALPYTIKGRFALMSDHPADLFILKEPETVTVSIYQEGTGKIYAFNVEQQGLSANLGESLRLIKTITVTI